MIINGLDRSTEYLKEELIEHCSFYEGAKDVFVDIGAHVGIASMWAATNGFKKVIAIEPQYVNFIHLLDNIMQNEVSDIVIPVLGAWCPESMKDTVPIKSVNPENSSGQHSLCFNDNFGILHWSPVYSSRDIINRAGSKIDFLKVDIEGGEFKAFTDPATKELFKSASFLDYEIHGPNPRVFDPSYFKECGFNSDDPLAEMFAIIKELGFTENSALASCDFRGYRTI